MEDAALSVQMGSVMGASTRDDARADDWKGCVGKVALRLSDNVSWCYPTHPLAFFRGKPSAKKIRLAAPRDAGNSLVTSG